MNYSICQQVKIVDMNNEPITETLYVHGSLDTPNFSIGCSVIVPTLGLKQFEVVEDRRGNEKRRFKISDIEIDIMENPVITRAYLEPITLIVGQHDIGEF
ncbi:hypothetical protein SY83_03765 [Paenibacillus swuensis]|uniref:Uncharacterized protein n=1 Tax=Paenibacillus swuensis TaxID=1178515 RepID=A0A172TFA8_9BACL|nr:hypothetical protein [Paenibacillus swuensis]ANE45567.1 hypothetical protein SY83_03765 [Paenibacillus swuensis]